MTTETKELYRVLVKRLAFIEETIKNASKDDVITYERLKARRNEIELVIDYLKR